MRRGGRLEVGWNVEQSGKYVIVQSLCVHGLGGISVLKSANSRITERDVIIM